MSTHSQKGNALVVVLVLVVIAAGGGYLGYKLFWSNQDKNTETIEGMMVDTAGDEEADNDMMSGEAGDNGMMGTDDGVVRHKVQKRRPVFHKICSNLPLVGAMVEAKRIEFKTLCLCILARPLWISTISLMLEKGP